VVIEEAVAAGSGFEHIDHAALATQALEAAV